MKRVWVLQHIRTEPLGTIADALDEAGAEAHYVRAFEGDSVPKDMSGADGLVVLGGPMGVYEHPRYPFLLDEVRLIARALADDKPVLGICLGSQLLAAALGAGVTRGTRKEIGWFSLTLTELAAEDLLMRGVEFPFVGFHWHGDVFELPRGAVLLASSALTEHQAYRFGDKAYGFLFHMEVTRKIVEDMAASFAGELEEEGLDGRAIVGASDDYLHPLQAIGASVFRSWVNLSARARSWAPHRAT